MDWKAFVLVSIIHTTVSALLFEMPNTKWNIEPKSTNNDSFEDPLHYRSDKLYRRSNIAPGKFNLKR